MGEFFIPDRNKKELKIPERRVKKTEEQNSENLQEERTKDERENILKDYLKNEEYKKIIEKVKNDEGTEKERLNLAQFKRFYNLVKENKFDFFDEKEEIKKFIKKQIEREQTKDFYIFIWNEFCYFRPKKIVTKKNELKIKAEEINEKGLKNLDENTIKKIQENKSLKKEIAKEIEMRIEIIEKYFLYILGEKRIKEKLENKMEVK